MSGGISRTDRGMEKTIDMLSLRYRLGRVRAFLWRFHTLPFAARVFADAPRPCILSRSFCGFTLLVDVSRTNTHRLLYLDGERFVAERYLLRRLLQPGMRVADVGANIGYFLLLIESVVGAKGAIVCLEPEPDNAVELNRNIQHNGLKNVEVLPLWRWGDIDGIAFLQPGINGVVTLDNSGSLQVPLRRLDSVLEPNVDFIKVDVEGFEYQVLRGGEETFRRQQPTLLVEIHPGLIAQPYSVADIFDFLGHCYSDLEAYAPAPQTDIYDKVTTRYLGLGTVRRFPDLKALLSACSSGEQAEPFWVVCKPRSASN